MNIENLTLDSIKSPSLENPTNKLTPNPAQRDKVYITGLNDGKTDSREYFRGLPSISHLQQALSISETAIRETETNTHIPTTEKEAFLGVQKKSMTYISEEIRRRELGGEPAIPNILTDKELVDVLDKIVKNRPGIEKQYSKFTTIKGLQEILRDRTNYFNEIQSDFTISPTERERARLLGNMEIEVIKAEIEKGRPVEQLSQTENLKGVTDNLITRLFKTFKRGNY